MGRDDGKLILQLLGGNGMSSSIGTIHSDILVSIKRSDWLSGRTCTVSCGHQNHMLSFIFDLKLLCKYNVLIKVILSLPNKFLIMFVHM